MATVKHVVLDSGAFLRNVKVENIAEKVYTLPDVVSEIKDKATKQRLQVLPYELNYKEPSAEAIKFVTEFAKKTGDYGSLSAVDIRVMALAYHLEKEIVGTGHIKTEPDKKIVWSSSKRPLEKATDIAGFYVKPKINPNSRTVSECSSVNPEPSDLRGDDAPGIAESGAGDALNKTNPVGSDTTETLNNEFELSNVTENIFDKQTEISETNQANNKDTDQTVETNEVNHSSSNKSKEFGEGDIIPEDMIGEESDSDEENDDDDDDDSDDNDDDDDGWITPSNIKSVKQQMGGQDVEKADVQVGCLTTDFAMQNVLIQMGLNVISVDGMLIKRAKSFVIRCFACFKITTDVGRTFCPHCGNKTLSKVSMTVNEDGSIKYFLSRRRPINIRGKKRNLPLPRGGKHAINPRLVEDQPAPQNRVSKKSSGKLDVFDPDYVAGSSPFTLNDVTSRAAQLGIRSNKGQYWDRRHPKGNTRRK